MAKAPKKPTAAALVQQLSVQVAELRGRVERLESKNSTSTSIDEYPRAARPFPWYWFKGIEHR